MKQVVQRFISVALLTFLLSVAASASSRSLLDVFSFGPSLVLLLIIVLIGILFDIIGVAATASTEEPFHAMAVDRVRGSLQAIRLVRNADRVATVCNDVVGDVAGTLSGAIGAGIVFRLVALKPDLNETLATTIMVAIVAALTVSGKSLGKSLAINNANKIVFYSGVFLFWLEKLFGLRILAGGNNKKGKKKSRSRNKGKSK